MRSLTHTLIEYLFISLKYFFATIFLLGGSTVAIKGQSVSISGPSSVCPNQQYTFTASASGVIFPCDYTWYVIRNGVAIAGPSGNLSFTYTFDNTLGPVTIRAILSRGIGCVSSTVGNKTVNITYKTPAPIIGPESICLGQTKRFGTDGLANSPADCFFHHLYRWTVPSGWQVEGQNGSYTGQKKSVLIKAPNSGGAQTVQIKVQGYYDDIGVLTPARVFNLRLGAPAMPIIRGPSEVPAFSLADYSVNTVLSATSYDWLVPPGWSIQGTPTASITVFVGTSGGDLKARATNACGNSAYRTKPVVVDNDGNPFLTAGPQIKMYPNPTKDYINLVLTGSDNTVPQQFSTNSDRMLNQPEGTTLLMLYGPSGELIYSESMTGGQMRLNTENLQNGQYILHVVTGSGTIREKLFIEK